MSGQSPMHPQIMLKQTVTSSSPVDTKKHATGGSTHFG